MFFTCLVGVESVQVHLQLDEIFPEWIVDVLILVEELVEWFVNIYDDNVSN